MTATKIYKVTGSKDYQRFRAGCACGSPECDQDITLEVESDTRHITVCIETTLTHRDYNAEYCSNIFKRFAWRIKSALTIIFTGKLTASAWFVFDKADQVKDYTTAINKAYDIINENSKFSRTLNDNRISTID